MVSLFIEIVIFLEFITKPRNSNSWVGFKIDFCLCISNPSFVSKFTVTSIFSRHSLSVFHCKLDSSTNMTDTIQS